MKSQPQDEHGRRQAARIPLPFEVRLTHGDRTVEAIIRDVSVGQQQQEGFTGVGMLHGEPLPVNTALKCQCLSKSNLLPANSTVTLVWTRNFGADGYLSGGKMFREVSEAVCALN